jgi:hypothetical protein
MNNPLSALTNQIGMPQGFFDKTYPFALYQTATPKSKTTGMRAQLPTNFPRPMNPLSNPFSTIPNPPLFPPFIQMMMQMRG